MVVLHIPVPQTGSKHIGVGRGSNFVRAAMYGRIGRHIAVGIFFLQLHVAVGGRGEARRGKLSCCRK